jgi:radical SAM superfamily enzyme YgiQ (UPF0313 family)
MRIALISPRTSFGSNNPELNEFWSKSPDLIDIHVRFSTVSSALLVIAALTPDEHEVEFIDDNFDQIDFDRHYDIVGISLFSQQARRGYEIAARFRGRALIVMGGIHATLMPDEVKQHADSVVVGEAEYLWSDVLQDAKNGCLKPFYRSDRMVDMRDSPLPRYDLLKPERYKWISLQTSRGCPHDCEYCSASKIFGGKYRIKTVEQTLAEIQYVHDNFGQKMGITFSDDNFGVNHKAAKEILEGMLERFGERRIRFNVACDVSIGTQDEILRLLERTGCMSLFIGFEAISESSLAGLDARNWKLRQLQNYGDYIKHIQSFGIPVFGAFMVGLDGDDVSVFDAVGDFVIKNHLFAATVYIIQPFPGTRFRERVIAENRLINPEWDKYTMYDVNHIPAKMTVEELQSGLPRLYKRIYSPEVNAEKMRYFKEIRRQLILSPPGVKGGRRVGTPSACFAGPRRLNVI